MFECWFATALMLVVLLETRIISGVCYIEDWSHVPCCWSLHLFEQRLEVDPLWLPELDFLYWPGVVPVLQHLGAVLAQHLLHLCAAELLSTFAKFSHARRRPLLLEPSPCWKVPINTFTLRTYRGGAAYLYLISILIWPHFGTYPYISIQNILMRA